MILHRFRNGTVSTADFRARVESLRIPISNADFEALFSDLDPQHTGSVSMKGVEGGLQYAQQNLAEILKMRATSIAESHEESLAKSHFEWAMKKEKDERVKQILHEAWAHEVVEAKTEARARRWQKKPVVAAYSTLAVKRG